MKTKLDSFEQEIEDKADKFVNISDKKMAAIYNIIDQANKTRNINIRMTDFDLKKIKEKAASDGLPYQTLISSVIHRYITGKLVDEQTILKSIELIQYAGR